MAFMFIYESGEFFRWLVWSPTATQQSSPIFAAASTTLTPSVFIFLGRRRNCSKFFARVRTSSHPQVQQRKTDTNPHTHTHAKASFLFYKHILTIWDTTYIINNPFIHTSTNIWTASRNKSNHGLFAIRNISTFDLQLCPQQILDLPPPGYFSHSFVHCSIHNWRWQPPVTTCK